MSYAELLREIVRRPSLFAWTIGAVLVVVGVLPMLSTTYLSTLWLDQHQSALEVQRQQIRVEREENRKVGETLLQVLQRGDEREAQLQEAFHLCILRLSTDGE